MIKLEVFMEVFKLRGWGFTISAISRETGLDRKTVRKYLKQGKSKPPEMKKRTLRPSKLSSYEADIKSLMRGPENHWPPATVIYEELIKKGYDGSLSLIQKWIKQYKQMHLPKQAVAEGNY